MVVAARAPARESSAPVQSVSPPTVQRSAAPAPRVRASSDPRFSGVLQRKSALQVSSPSDPAEKEAESTAQKIMRAPDSAAGAPPAPTPTAGVMRAYSAAPSLARKGTGKATTTADVAAEISAAGSGAPLPPAVRRFMEARFHAKFDNVRVHTDAQAAKLSAKVSAQAFTVGNQIFFGKGQWQPDSSAGKELLAHELTHTIQQGAAVQRRADVSVSQHSPPQVQRLGMSDVLDFVADKANMIPGYRMFTIVIGVNPVNMSAVDRSAANILRAIVEFLPGGGLITQALDRYGVFDKVGGWIEKQLSSLGISGAATKQALTDFIGTLGLRDLFSPGDVWNRAKRIFSGPVDRIISFVKSLAGAVLKFIKDAILRPLAELASKEPAWDLLCAVMGKNPITGEAVPRNAETLIGGFMKLIGQEEIWENIKKGNAIAKAFAWFQTALSGLLGFVRQIPTLFLEALRSLEIADIVLLPRAFVKVAMVFGGFFGKFLKWAGGTIWDLLEIIVSVVAPGVLVYLKKAQAAFKKIIKNPIGFVGNLVKAGKQGLNQFVTKFPAHLKASLIGWLTGALGGAGVYIPTAFTLVEIGKCVLSVLGITWPQIRGKIVKALGPNGEMIMKGLEAGFAVVKAFVTGGVAAVWDLIKQKLTDLRDTVLASIISFVKGVIIQKAITLLVSMLNPAGAFVQAVIAIYNGVMAFVERMKQIAQVVAAFIDSISAIADGAIGAAANRVEQTMGGLLTLVISFLARIVGLGGIAAKIVELIKVLQAKVDAALEKGITWIIERAKGLFKALFGKKDKDAELGPIAQRVAARGWTLASQKSRSDLQREPALKTVLKDAEAEVPAGATAKLALKTSGTTWQVEATVSKEGKQAKAAAGSGWIAEDLQGKPAYAGQNLAGLHQKIITDAVAQLSAAGAEGKPLRQAYDEKVALARQIEQSGQQQITQRIKGIKFTIEMEGFEKVEGDRAIETTLTIAPNKERLKANVPAAPAPGLAALQKALAASKILGKEQSSIDRILRICQKIAKDNGATVAVQNRNPAAATSPVAFMVVFTVGTDKLELPVERKSSGPECAACEANPGTVTPHNIIPESELRKSITAGLAATLGALSTIAPDHKGVSQALSAHDLIISILGTAAVGGEAVSKGPFQKQCARCEGQVAGVPGQGTLSLVQRVTAAAAVKKGGGTPAPEAVGLQFGGSAATLTEATDLTRLKVRAVVVAIGRLAAGIAGRYPAYAIAATLTASAAALGASIEADALRRVK